MGDTPDLVSKPGSLVYAMLGFAGASLLGYTWATVSHLDVPAWTSPTAMGLLMAVASIAIAVWKPLWGALLVFACIPLFGNHPGGRLMEVINIPLAAVTIGLLVHARRRALPPPSGMLWWCAGLYVFSALVAFIAAAPGVLVHWVSIGQPSAALAEALTAPENNPLYSLGSLVMVGLAMSWALALAWTKPGLVFARQAFICVAASFFVIVVVGAFDVHGLVTLQHVYQNRIDPRTYDPGTFQSIFWNPGWFAWYFTIAFGMTVGLTCAAPKPWRQAIAAALAVSYVYFLANPQRGGFIALNASLLAIAALAVVRTGWRPSRRLVLTTVGVIAVVAVASVPYVSRSQGPWLSSLRRFSSKDAQVAQSNSERMKVYRVALRMWQSAPVFGIGESAFSWRYREFVNRPSEADTKSTGDAHSTWLQVLATRGLLGLFAYALVLVAAGQLVVRTLSSSDPERRALGIGLAVGMLAFVTYSFVQAMFYMQGIQVFFWGMVALAAIVSPAAADTLPSRASTVVAQRRGVVAQPFKAARNAWTSVTPYWKASALAFIILLQVWSSRAMFYQALARMAPGRPALESFMRTFNIPRAIDDEGGFMGWEMEPDGRPFRWIDRTATFMVPPQTAAIDIPLRLLRLEPKPVDLSISLDGREVNVVRLDENWTVYHQLLVPRDADAAWQSIQLRVKGAWSPVKVGDLRIVQAGSNRR